MALPIDLRPYAEQIASVAGKTVLGDSVFVQASDLYSTALFSVTQTSGVVPAQTRSLFSITEGQTGQGATVAHTSSQTNMPAVPFGANELYVGLACGFEIFGVTSTADFKPLLKYSDAFTAGAAHAMSSWDVAKLSQAMTWSYQVGAGPVRTRGVVASYPTGSYVVSPAAASIASGNVFEEAVTLGGPLDGVRHFAGSPVIFPPNVKVNITVSVQDGVTILDQPSGAIGAFAVVMHFRGYRLTLPA